MGSIYEPAILRNMEILEQKIDALSEAMIDGFGRIEMRLDRVEGEVVEVKVELHELNRRVGSLEMKVDGVDERLESLERAFDKDSVTLVKHEIRIRKLEKIQA